VTNRIKIPEVEDVLRYLGTDIVSLPGRSECPDPNDSDNAVATIDRMVSAEPEKYHHTSQYTNLDNPKAHQETTAKELYADLETIDYIVTGVGTGGSSGGMLEYIKEHDLPTKCIGVVAHPSDFLPGIRTKNELFETPLFQERWFADITEVTTEAALEALDILVRREGVLAGPTTGANFAAALEWSKAHDALREDGSRKTLVLVACDRLEPYMSYLKKRLPERFGLTSRNDVYQLSEYGEVPDIEVAELAKKLASPTPPLVIDTRGVKAYGLFHIAGSLCYPEQLLQELFEDGAPFAADEVVFVCPKGDRSKLYAGLLL
jgi:cysteine synthase B